jgi:hypothetical protein
MRSEAERWVSVERELGCLSLHLPSAPLVLAFQQQREEGSAGICACTEAETEAGFQARRQAVLRAEYGARFQAEQEKAGRAQQAGHCRQTLRGDFLEGRAGRLGGRDI